MKKALTIVLVALMMLSTSAVALADNTTVLTTTVPAATYTLNIPADQTIAFGATSTDIGSVTVTDATGFAEGKNLNVALIFDSFKCESVTTTIPFLIAAHGSSQTGNHATSTLEIKSGEALTFKGNSSGGVDTPEINSSYSFSYFSVDITSADWGKALGGDYTATITFTAEVVVE